MQLFMYSQTSQQCILLAYWTGISSYIERKKIGFMFIPKFGLNNHCIDLMLNLNLDSNSHYFFDSIGLSVTIRVSIFRNPFLPLQTFTGSSPHNSQYKLNKMLKAIRNDRPYKILNN